MNILLVNINLGTARCVGGIETHSDLLASVLADKGHNVIVGCWVDGTIVTRAEGRELQARRITIRNSGDIRAMLKIAEICRKESISVVLANNGREYWPSAVAAGIAGAKVIFIRHQTDPIRITTRYLINHSVSKIVAVSGAVQTAILGSGIRPDNVEVIPNFVLLSRFDPAKTDRVTVREKLGFLPSDEVIGYVGKLEEGKGIFDLLTAAAALRASHPKLRLLFVGGGTKSDDLRREAERLSMSDMVTFTGIRRDVQDLYAAMDVFVLPSTCDEAFGIVLIEAMAMGTPVIGTAVGGIPEIISHEETGLLSPPGDAASLANNIKRYLDDHGFAETVAAAGQLSAREKFSEKAAGNSFDRLIRDAAGNGKRA